MSVVSRLMAERSCVYLSYRRNDPCEASARVRAWQRANAFVSTLAPRWGSFLRRHLAPHSSNWLRPLSRLPGRSNRRVLVVWRTAPQVHPELVQKSVMLSASNPPLPGIMV